MFGKVGIDRRLSKDIDGSAGITRIFYDQKSTRAGRSEYFDGVGKSLIFADIVDWALCCQFFVIR